MRLRVSARFEKDLKSLDSRQRDRVQKALRQFLVDPRHPSLHFEKLRGHERLHTIRFSLSERIFLRATAEADLFELDRLGPHDLYNRFR